MSRRLDRIAPARLPVRLRRGLSFALVVASAGCGGEEPSREPAPEQPPGFADELALAAIEDENPDPHVLEVTLEARVTEHEILPGKRTKAWTYNGSLPGPLLRLRAGDRLVVHFRNALPEPTTVHWHGIRLPNDMDGSPPHSQAPVEPGGTFDYDFVVPDPGLYWYHPHERSAAQIGFGLYGALLVDPAPDDPASGLPEQGLGDEVVLVLSDIALAEDGSLLPPDGGGDLANLFGREGNAILVNGRVRPTLRARSGLWQRWRLVNAAKSRYFDVRLDATELFRIGGDTGLLPAAERGEGLVLVPGARADVVVRPLGEPGAELDLVWHPYDRGYGSTEFREPEPILRVAFADGETAGEKPLPQLGPEIAPLDTAGATPIEIHLTQGTDSEGHIDFGIDGVPFWEAEPIAANVGETQVWTVHNDMDFSHPFHLHGFFFQPLGESGEPRRPVEWRDTVDVAMRGTTRFAVRYDARPGMWMFHCHILDHADGGMMGMVHVHAH